MIPPVLEDALIARMDCPTCETVGLENLTHCVICHRNAEKHHPCRFEIACSCWLGKPCDGSGRIRRP